MKKFLFILLATLSIISCEDVEDNKLALQANVDNNFYTSTDARASLNQDGTFTIQGFTEDESMTLQLTNLAKGNFVIEEGKRNYAIYEDMGGSIYTTKPNGEGVITISELNETNKTVTGIFNFNAFLVGIDTIYVSKGVFNDVPYSDGTIIDPSNVGTFSAEVNGDQFSAIVVTSNTTVNSIIISGNTANSTIVITTTVDVEAGDYSLPIQGFAAKYQGVNGPETTSEGLITILEHNTAAKTMKGTFSFLTNRSEITKGKFDISY